MKKPLLSDIQSKVAANPSLAALNPHLFNAPKVEILDLAPKPVVGKRRKQMNQTEHDFSLILEAKRKREEIVSWEYEGLTLRWGKLDNIQYTPDFVVFEKIQVHPGCSIPLVRICCIEVKGPKIWPKDIAKFKQARNEWPLFGFELWQRPSRGAAWGQIL